ncbi:amyloid protein-binding protein 2-like [Acropora muricata]|uniref:amyloid protein-binding protein 2-like n=1 Tax=Acropora muricata TaxID=159855 RepID=UPI0034E6134F
MGRRRCQQDVNMANCRIENLYKLAASTTARNCDLYKCEFRSLPNTVQCDIYRQLYETGKTEVLVAELSELDVVSKVLRAGDTRIKLLTVFQGLREEGFNLSSLLATEFLKRCDKISVGGGSPGRLIIQRILKIGMSLGGFLSEGGWYEDAEDVLANSYKFCNTRETEDCKIATKFLTRLLHVRAANCKFDAAKDTFQEAVDIASKLDSKNQEICLAVLYGEKCGLLFSLSDYGEGYVFSVKALRKIGPGLPMKAVVDILRNASKACVVKRKFKKAELLIKQAMFLAKKHFGCDHPKYADTLIDYGYYLLNVDAIHLSVKVYKEAFRTRLCVFGYNNLHVATAHEDLGYALYVHEYSTGNFDEARYHAERAISIITNLFPDDHLLLASSKRVKALILEEIAIDNPIRQKEEEILKEAQELHLASLDLARKSFGENNVQTAKHYGNLGRLFQSMRKYKEAEDMHKKAIEIKERILGSEDYEVALSLGHLASLYNYDMEQYDKAEQLYLRSIAIGKKLFGDGYSGLEYDYRGLINLYDSQGDFDRMETYHQTLMDWKDLRETANRKESAHEKTPDPWPTGQFIQNFLSQPD